MSARTWVRQFSPFSIIPHDLAADTHTCAAAVFGAPMSQIAWLMRRLAVLVVFAPVALAGTSCTTQTGTVQGTITVGGKALPSGLITFQSEVGNHDVFSAKITNGSYETSAIPCGPAKISIIHSMVETSQAHVEAGGNDLVPGSPRKAAAGPTRIQVPSRFHSPDTSQLSITIKPGVNTFDQDLVP